MVFVVLVAGPYYADALWDWEGDVAISDAVAVAIIVGVFFATGFLVGRWWSLVVLVVPVLLTWPLGVSPGDSDGWTYAWLLIWGPMLIGAPCLVAGYVTRVLADLVRARQA